MLAKVSTVNICSARWETHSMCCASLDRAGGVVHPAGRAGRLGNVGTLCAGNLGGSIGHICPRQRIQRGCGVAGRAVTCSWTSTVKLVGTAATDLCWQEAAAKLKEVPRLRVKHDAMHSTCLLCTSWQRMSHGRAVGRASHSWGDAAAHEINLRSHSSRCR